MKVKNRACEFSATFSGIRSPVTRTKGEKIDPVLNEPSGRMLFAHKCLSRELLRLIPY